jgi:hypothetical protein
MNERIEELEAELKELQLTVQIIRVLRLCRDNGIAATLEEIGQAIAARRREIERLSRQALAEGPGEGGIQ